MIDRAVRQVEKERKKLSANEKKYLTDIKTLAKQNKHVRVSFYYSPQQKY